MTGTESDRAAADWLARRDSGAWTAQDQQQLAAWLDQSTANRVAFLRLDRVWSRADRLAALAHGDDAELVPEPPPRLVPDRSLLAKIAAIAAVAAAAAFLYVSLPNTVETGIGERRTIVLADGSSVELGPLSKIKYRNDADRRSIWIESGEAYFDVRHDPARPFVVLAGDQRIVDVGTRFSVRRDTADVSVAVIEGRVEIDSTAAPQRAAVMVNQGGLADARADAPVRIAHDPVAVANRLSWRSGMLAFDATPLADVAAEFNRYNRQQLVIASPTAGAMQIGGRFRATHVDGFAALLRDNYGLKVQVSDTQITVSD